MVCIFNFQNIYPFGNLYNFQSYLYMFYKLDCISYISHFTENNLTNKMYNFLLYQHMKHKRDHISHIFHLLCNIHLYKMYIYLRFQHNFYNQMNKENISYFLHIYLSHIHHKYLKYNILNNLVLHISLINIYYIYSMLIVYYILCKFKSSNILNN